MWDFVVVFMLLFSCCVKCIYFLYIPQHLNLTSVLRNVVRNWRLKSKYKFCHINPIETQMCEMEEPLNRKLGN